MHTRLHEKNNNNMWSCYPHASVLAHTAAEHKQILMYTNMTKRYHLASWLTMSPPSTHVIATRNCAHGWHPSWLQAMSDTGPEYA